MVPVEAGSAASPMADPSASNCQPPPGAASGLRTEVCGDPATMVPGDRRSGGNAMPNVLGAEAEGGARNRADRTARVPDSRDVQCL